MKNKLNNIFLVLIFNILFLNYVTAEEFNFNITELQITESGNLITGIKGGTVTTRNNEIIITAENFKYNKLSTLLEAEGNVVDIADSGLSGWTDLQQIKSVPQKHPILNYTNAIVSGHVDEAQFYNAPNANLNSIFGYDAHVDTAPVEVADSDNTKVAISTFSPVSGNNAPTYNALKGDVMTFVRCSTLTHRSLMQKRVN